MESLDIRELYSTRMLLFVETSPQSNKYHQVFVDPEQFKKISDAVFVKTDDVDGEEVGYVRMSVDSYQLPDLQEIHDKI